MTDRLRICLVSAAYYPYPSGVSEHVHHLAVSLQQLGQEVQILTTRFPGDCDESPGPIPVTRIGRAVLIPMNRSFATLPVGLRMPAQVKNFLRTNRFDIVHCHGLAWPEISYWASLYNETTTLVSFLTAGFKIHTRGAKLVQWLFRRQFRNIDGLVPISKRARRAFEAYVPGDYRIIPCGVDIERFRPDLAPLPETKPTGQTILFLGRLDARKGIRVLLETMPRLLAILPQVRLIVVGTGPEERHARRLVAKLTISDRIDFVGRVSREDLPRYYTGCDVYCSPTLGGETLGIVLLEAMASGTPVVASDIPGYDETVRNRVDGLLVPPGNPAALADALAGLLKNRELMAELTTAGLARAREYAWPVIARRTLDYYRELRER